MSDRSNTASALQFSLRGLALLMLAVGVYLGALAPWLRNYTSTQLWRFWLFWLCTLAGTFAFLVLFGVLQRKAEIGAGRVHYVLDRGAGGRLLFALAGIVQVAVCTNFAFMFSGWEDIPPNFWAVVLAPFFGSGGAMMLVMVWWRMDQVQLREQGLLMPLGWIPWNLVQSWGWLEQSGRPTLCVNTNRREFRLRVDESGRSGVEEFLAQHVPSSDPR